MRKSRLDLKPGLLDEKIMEFLESKSAKTRKTYLAYFKIIQSHMPESGTQMLRNHKQWERKILVLHTKLLEMKPVPYSVGTAQSCLGALRGFFVYYGKKLELGKQQLRQINLTARNSTDYFFTQGDLARMCDKANVKEKYVVLAGASYGLRSEDLVELTYGQYRLALAQENLEPPIALGEVLTMKELGVKAHPFISSDLLPVVKELLNANPDAKDSDRVYEERPIQLTQVVQRLFRKAGLDSHGSRVRYHNLRKYLFSRLVSVSSTDRAKQIIGKKVPAADGAYLDTTELREVYQRATPSIVVGNGTEVKRRVGSLEEENKRLTAELAEVKLKIENISAGKQEVLRDLATTFNTEELKMLKEMLRKKEPTAEVDVADEVQKEVKE